MVAAGLRARNRVVAEGLTRLGEGVLGGHLVEPDGEVGVERPHLLRGRVRVRVRVRVRSRYG